MTVARGCLVLVTSEPASRLVPWLMTAGSCDRVVDNADHRRDDTETQENNNGITAECALPAQESLRRRCYTWCADPSTGSAHRPRSHSVST